MDTRRVSVRVLVQAAVAAPGGSVTVLRDVVAAWPGTDDLLIVCWRPAAARLLADAGAQVVTVPARSTVEALLRLRAGAVPEIRGWRPDVVWSQAVRLPGATAPQAVHWRDIGSFADIHPSSTRRLLKQHVESRDLRRAELRVFNSEAMRSAVLARHPRVGDLPSVVVHNGLELHGFLAVPPPRAPGPRPLRLLLPQADAPHKRNHVAAEVLSGLHLDPPPPFTGARLTVLGGGAYSDLLSAAAARGVRHLIDLPGYVDRAAVAAAHAGTDVVLVTSSGESFCNPAVEAAAAGRPLVAPPLPVLRETGGPGAVLAADGTAAALEAAVRATVRAGTASGSAARRHAEGFTASRAAARLRTALVTLLERTDTGVDRGSAGGWK